MLPLAAGSVSRLSISFLYQPGIAQSGFSLLSPCRPLLLPTMLSALKVQRQKFSDLKDLRPTTGRKTFIAPDTMGAAFAKQTIKDAVKVGHWYETTAQYVLMLSEK
jgi:hypothetical protein